MFRLNIVLIAFCLSACVAAAPQKKPNILWLLVESTAVIVYGQRHPTNLVKGYAYFPNATAPMPIPAIRKLQQRGLGLFHEHSRLMCDCRCEF